MSWDTKPPPPPPTDPAGWAGRTSKDVHVVPTKGAHTASYECWCRPSVDYTDMANGGRVWVHKIAA